MKKSNATAKKKSDQANPGFPRAIDVITVLEAASARYGAPEYIRSDNGPEFIDYAIHDWLFREHKSPDSQKL